MHRALRPLLLAAGIAGIVAPAFADPAGDALGACLVDKSTGRDRKDLARWMFVAMTAHSEIQDLSAVTPQMREDVTRKAAQVFTRLLTVDCLDEARRTASLNGGAGMQGAGGKLGEVAMRELVTDAQVTRAIADIAKYTDMAAIAKLLQQP
ncbi:MAG: hypothetical protein ACTHL8_03465 [Burkholderiaceae bacterium]